MFSQPGTGRHSVGRLVQELNVCTVAVEDLLHVIFINLFLQVKSDVLKGYFKSAGIGRCIFVLVMHALYAVTQILANIWLSEWSNDKFRNQTEAEGMVPLRLGVYGGLSAASCEWLTFSMYAQLLDILTLNAEATFVQLRKDA